MHQSIPLKQVPIAPHGSLHSLLITRILIITDQIRSIYSLVPPLKHGLFNGAFRMSENKRV